MVPEQCGAPSRATAGHNASHRNGGGRPVAADKPDPGLTSIPSLVTEEQVRAMNGAALDVISSIGLEVPEEAWRRKLKSAGARLSATRVQFPPEMVEEFLRAWREENGLPEPGWRDLPGPIPRLTALPLHVNIYPHHHVGLGSDELRPISVEDLVRLTQFVENFHADGVCVGAPGVPQDVPPAVQPIAQYKIGAQYSRAGGQAGWLAPPSTAEYVFRMAEAMGAPIQHVTVFCPTPLRLSAVELDVVQAFPGQFSSIGVGTMPAVGSTAPIYPKAAMVLALAETLAAAVALRILTGLPTSWSAGIHAFDLRAMAMVFGTPEMLLFHEMSKQVFAYYCGGARGGTSHYMQTMAKLPGVQAAADKAASAAFAVCCGATSLAGIGTLCLDDIFSPEQFITDLEIRDWALRFARGDEAGDGGPATWVSLIREGVEKGSFVSTDETLDHYREVYWSPRLFGREMLSHWLHSPEPDARVRAKSVAREHMVEGDYRLTDPRFGELEAIYEEASRKLARS
jgi:trimethylamine--corrinoid protein Co-methyltransferase